MGRFLRWLNEGPFRVPHRGGWKIFWLVLTSFSMANAVGALLVLGSGSVSGWEILAFAASAYIFSHDFFARESDPQGPRGGPPPPSPAT